MTKYRYFILLKCFPETGAVTESSESELNKLLDEGWVPTRETEMEGAPFPGSQTTVPGTQTIGIGYVFASLILLQRDEK